MNTQSFPDMQDSQFTEMVLTSLNKLAVQGKQSRAEDGRCLYRSDEPEVCCAVGHMIKDEFYNSDLEDQNATCGKVLEAIALSQGAWLTREQIRLVNIIQRSHDFAHAHLPGTDSFKTAMVKSLKQHNTFADDSQIFDKMEEIIKSFEEGSLA